MKTLKETEIEKRIIDIFNSDIRTKVGDYYTKNDKIYKMANGRYFTINKKENVILTKAF